MKFKIVRSKFLEGLKKVQNIVASKGTMQILQNVLIEAKDKQLLLTTTDLDISIRSVIGCDVEVDGATTLPVKLLFNVVSKAAEGTVEVTVDAQDRAVINAGTATFKLTGMSVVDYPTLPVDQNSFEYVIPQITLKEMLRKTAYAVSQDDTRKTLKGVLSSFKDGKLTMVATDGRRLALVEHEIELPAEAERDVILPAKVVNELQRSLTSDGDARITIEKTQIAFNLGDTRIYSKLLDEAATEVAESTDIVPIKYDGARIEIVFNPNYVMDPLKAIDEDEVTIELNDGMKPAMIKCSIPFLYVMMPLRVSN